MQNILKVLTKGVVPLVKIADTMLKVMLGKQEMPAEQDLFQSLTDSIGLLATASHSLNMRRREAMMPELNADFKCLKSKNVPLTTHLFGNELEKTLEDISKANRVGKKVDKRRKHQFNHFSRRGFHHQRGGYKALLQQRRRLFPLLPPSGAFFRSPPRKTSLGPQETGGEEETGLETANAQVGVLDATSTPSTGFRAGKH